MGNKKKNVSSILTKLSSRDGSRLREEVGGGRKWTSYTFITKVCLLQSWGKCVFCGVVADASFLLRNNKQKVLADHIRADWE